MHLLLSLLIGGVIFAASAAAATVYGTPVPTQDWTGSRTVGNGLASNDGSMFPIGSGISWSITDNGDGTLTYAYSFFGVGDSQLEPSHFILELSQGCITGNDSPCVVWDFQRSYEFSEEWKSSPSNPGMPGSIYGVKFDAGQVTYSFISDRIPVWGNFYAKKGNDGMWNLGLTGEEQYQENTLYFVARPDTNEQFVIPEPGTMALMGLGLLGLGLWRRRR